MKIKLNVLILMKILNFIIIINEDNLAEHLSNFSIVYTYIYSNPSGIALSSIMHEFVFTREYSCEQPRTKSHKILPPFCHFSFINAQNAFLNILCPFRNLLNF